MCVAEYLLSVLWCRGGCEGDVDDVEVEVLVERARDCDDAWIRTGKATTQKLATRDSGSQPQLRNPAAIGLVLNL